MWNKHSFFLSSFLHQRSLFCFALYRMINVGQRFFPLYAVSHPLFLFQPLLHVLVLEHFGTEVF